MLSKIITYVKQKIKKVSKTVKIIVDIIETLWYYVNENETTEEDGMNEHSQYNKLKG